MSLLVTKQGLLTTVQDLGRCGYQRFGVNPSGAMDPIAARLVNELLGNEPTAAVLEMHFPAGEYLFESEVEFAVGGADFCGNLSGSPISNWTVLNANTGDRLRFRKKHKGNRAYLAVKGGLRVNPWLGSSSTSLVSETGGLDGRRLAIGDRLPILKDKEVHKSSYRRLGCSIIPRYSSRPFVRLTPGPEFDVLTTASLETLLNDDFTISTRSDRMGFRLEGPPLGKLSDTELLSSGTTFGTIQLLPDGQMIVLMADHQTTGGYPRIATITAVDLPLVAQLGPGDALSFDLIEIADAEALLAEFERQLGFLRFGVRVANSSL
jgi:antagonist of KipI